MICSKNHNGLESILNTIEQRPELATFFNRLEDDPSLRTLFMLHPHELFMGSDDFLLPFFFSVSNPNIDKSLLLSVLGDLDQTRFQKTYRSFPFQMDEFLRIFFDLIVYGAITLARTNEDIKNLITDDFSYSRMKKVFGNLGYDEIWNDNWDKITNSINEANDPSLLQMKKEFEVSAKNWVKEFKSKPKKIIQSLLDMRIPNLYLAIHNDTSSHVGSVLKKTHLNIDNYNQILSLLYVLKLIKRQNSVFRCDDCIDEPQLLNSYSMIGSNRMNISCPRCGQQMTYSAVLWLDDFLETSLLNRDGLLSVALAFMLRKKNFEFEFSVKDDKFEYDFICQTKIGKILVECKVHRVPESVRSVKGSIEKDLQQASKHMRALDISSGVVVDNYNLAKYKDLVEKGIKKFGVRLIDFSEASTYFNSLSDSPN